MNFILGWILEDTEQREEVFDYLLRIEKNKIKKLGPFFGPGSRLERARQNPSFCKTLQR